MRAPVRLAAASFALGLGALSAGALSACGAAAPTTADGVGAYRLVSFDSCEDALTGLRTAAKAVVGPYGLGGYAIAAAGGAGMADGAVPPGARAAGDVASAPEAKAAAPEPAGGTYSGTNTHEVGVDEPDLVKTDGRRIVTVTGNALKVVDAASRTVTASIDLGESHIGDSFQYVPDELLLHGDQALVLMRYPYGVAYGGGIADLPAPGPVKKQATTPESGDVAGRGGREPAGPTKKTPTDGILGPRLVLVNLTGQGRVVSRVTADGALVDARQVGATVRVVIRSAPRISFPYPENQTDAQRLSANRAIIDQAPIEQWLPRIEMTAAKDTKAAPVDCSAISRPAVYTATNLVTVLSFDLAGASLGTGQPTTLVADGDTVYSNGPSLYLASDRRYFAKPVADNAAPAPATTEIYRFDTSGARPAFAAGGSVPGYLLNQYAMSEWDGKLRVATTTPAAPGLTSGSGQTSGSGVYVLAQDGKTLKTIGSVVGLGRGEQIYSVRFVGPTGYVVTFRQTDPLYTVDLQDPTKPAVRGELKIPGYSAYLHPAGAGRLIGIGQSATDQGRVKGTQVSLFDVGNLTSPGRIAQYVVTGGHSEAEFDPHAFLYWPATGLLVVPLQTSSTMGPRATGATGPTPGIVADAKLAGQNGALVLRVSGSTIVEVGYLQHPAPRLDYGTQIRRSLVIDRTLWTLSDGGLMASDLNSLAQLAWIPLA